MKSTTDLRNRCEFCEVVIFNNNNRNLCVVCNLQQKTTYCLNCEDNFSDIELLCEECYEFMKKEDATRDNVNLGMNKEKALEIIGGQLRSSGNISPEIKEAWKYIEDNLK